MGAPLLCSNAKAVHVVSTRTSQHLRQFTAGACAVNASIRWLAQHCNSHRVCLPSIVLVVSGYFKTRVIIKVAIEVQSPLSDAVQGKHRDVVRIFMSGGNGPRRIWWRSVVLNFSSAPIPNIPISFVFSPYTITENGRAILTDLSM